MNGDGRMTPPPCARFMSAWGLECLCLAVGPPGTVRAVPATAAVYWTAMAGPQPAPIFRRWRAFSVARRVDARPPRGFAACRASVAAVPLPSPPRQANQHRRRRNCCRLGRGARLADDVLGVLRRAPHGLAAERGQRATVRAHALHKRLLPARTYAKTRIAQPSARTQLVLLPSSGCFG